MWYGLLPNRFFLALCMPLSCLAGFAFAGRSKGARRGGLIAVAMVSSQVLANWTAIAGRGPRSPL